jgi:poly-gamma-glutamate capsule biosynthesis protein CapA/YwtB (metallophosphatase superfamily)
MPEERHLPAGDRKPVRLFLCGDVMCGRGIDQVLAHPCSPEIYERHVRTAETYVLLAEQANGPIPHRNGSSYVWGAALGQLERMQPDARIINLETAVTRSHDRANRGINYRVSPMQNVSWLPRSTAVYWPTTMCSIGAAPACWRR